MSVIRSRLRIGGMTCVNCQNKIKRVLTNTDGISEAEVSFGTGCADVAYDPNVITLSEIRAIIEKTGYEVLPETQRNSPDMIRNISLLIIIVSLYILLQHFGILNLLVPGRTADSKMSCGMLFVIGVTASVHCIAMCGGINLSQCIPKSEHTNENGGRLAAYRPALLYNIGRVISYTATGFLLGFAGMLIGGGSAPGVPVLLQGIIKIAAGIFMIITGINMLGIFPWLRCFNLRLPVSAAAKLCTKNADSRQPLIVGILNGLMPCGPLQSMQITALASGSPFAGALAMLMFGLGTVPLMLGLGSIVAALGRRFAQKVMSIGAVLVAVLGLAMLSQGGSLSGLISPDRLTVMIIMLGIIGIAADIPSDRGICKAAGIITVIAAVSVGSAVLSHMNDNIDIDVNADQAAAAEKPQTEDGVQVINSTLVPGRYPDITVQAGIPVKWIIDAPAGSVNGCNYKMILREYGIEHEFSEGENVIEFTPTGSGTVQYTCWMGMIRGSISVTDGNGSAAYPADEPSYYDQFYENYDYQDPGQTEDDQFSQDYIMPYGCCGAY